MLIPGPKSPGMNIDVYLRPLILELKELWDKGVTTWDAGTRKNFKLHAILLWTINDFQLMLCFLVGARKESLHVHTATKILSICGLNMEGSTATWDIDVSCPRTIHGATTRSASTTRSKPGRHQYHRLVHRYLSSLKVLNK